MKGGPLYIFYPVLAPAKGGKPATQAYDSIYSKSWKAVCNKMNYKF